MNIDKQIVTLAIALREKQGFYRLSNGTMVETVPEFYLANMDARLFPDYHKDLNAVFEAVEVWRGEPEFDLFFDSLIDVCGAFSSCVQSLAGQRLQALLRALKLWTND